jgi:hypothetical protein
VRCAAGRGSRDRETAVSALLSRHQSFMQRRAIERARKMMLSCGLRFVSVTMDDRSTARMMAWKDDGSIYGKRHFLNDENDALIWLDKRRYSVRSDWNARHGAISGSFAPKASMGQLVTAMDVGDRGDFMIVENLNPIGTCRILSRWATFGWRRQWSYQVEVKIGGREYTGRSSNDYYFYGRPTVAQRMKDAVAWEKVFHKYPVGSAISSMYLNMDVGGAAVAYMPPK